LREGDSPMAARSTQRGRLRSPPCSRGGPPLPDLRRAGSP
jgi:hypothetical protein